MKTLKMIDGDTVIENGGTVYIEKKEAVRQRLMNKLRLDKGSWFLNKEIGFPWFEIYNNKSVAERLIRSNAEDILKADPEVTKLTSLEISFDRAERKIKISFEVNTIYGTVEGSL